MNKSVAQQIRKFRYNKELSQDDMADELGITKGAYSKIERGLTAISIDRLAQIAKIFEVDITSFFKAIKPMTEVGEKNPSYGDVSKSDLEELTQIVNTLRADVLALKKSMQKEQPKKKALKKK